MTKDPSAALSPEARAFIRDTPTPENRRVTPETIGAIRESYNAAMAPAAEAMTETFLEAVEERVLGGVRVEVCQPRTLDADKADPAVLYLYGGGYVVGSPKEDRPITARLAHLLQRWIYAADYRLAPEHPFPAALEDALAVYQALLAEAGPAGLVVVGESAGGNLAVVLTLKAREVGLTLPRALALLSPWVDLAGESDSHRSHRGLDPSFGLDAEDDSGTRAYLGGADPKHPLVSPLYNDDWQGFPPTLITTGTRDLMVSDCARLARVLRRAGVPVTLNLWEGLWHVFECYPEIPEGEDSLGEIAAFLEAQLRT